MNIKQKLVASTAIWLPLMARVITPSGIVSTTWTG